MATMLAPYTNGMRLGQGFNSYTQQICLDQAVLPENPQNRAVEGRALLRIGAVSKTSTGTPSTTGSGLLVGSQTGDEGKQEPEDDYESQQRRAVVGQESGREPGGIEVPPWVKPQIVTYSSRFVDKISDVTDSMNISGTVAIKTSQVGGKLTGSYVDSDKFKSSDINFHLQVKVVNQVHDAKQFNIFNKIDTVGDNDFTNVYGDTFVSGWEEGGELNAIISVKVRDKSKIFDIKGGIEAQLNSGTIAGEVKADFGMQKTNISKETETTISVNWSGGGRIKDPSKDWTIATLKEAAAAFPDLVAITPQRTYAILTKYTALESFQRQKQNYSPLSYENAGVYTSSLMEHYMDYKALWKQVSQATFELEADRASIELAQPSQDIHDLAVVENLPAEQVQLQVVQFAKTGSNAPKSPNPDYAKPGQLDVSVPTARTETVNNVTRKKYTVFPSSFAGLIQARQVCRCEMAKIVNEVDLVAKNPNLATDARRDSHFLNPLVYKQLLPVVRSQSPENAILGIRDSGATLLLGYVQRQPDQRSTAKLNEFQLPLESHDDRVQVSVKRLNHKADDYRMHGCAGSVQEIHSQASFFNDLESLDATYRPLRFMVWTAEGRVQGLEVRYANGVQVPHGLCDGPPTHSLELAADGSEVVTEIQIKEAKDANDVLQIAAISVATSEGNSMSSDVVKAEITHSWTKLDQRQWTLRGLFGFYHDKRFVSLGVVWGKDGFVPVPLGRPRTPLAKSILQLSPDLQARVRSTIKTSTISEEFYLGDSISTNAAALSTSFTALDLIDKKWAVKGIAFASTAGQLSGLKVTYENGKELVHGAYSKETHSWQSDVSAPIVVARMTTRKAEASSLSYIDTVEFVKGDETGNLPDWPLDISTIRYLGSGKEASASDEIPEVIERAPVLGRSIWTLRGFYGEESGGIISRLGVIWGRG